MYQWQNQASNNLLTKIFSLTKETDLTTENKLKILNWVRYDLASLTPAGNLTTRPFKFLDKMTWHPRRDLKKNRSTLLRLHQPINDLESQAIRIGKSVSQI